MKTSLTSLITSFFTTFFTTYLSNVAGYSENTIKSYRDTFVLLFTFADYKKLCPRGRIGFDIFSKENITNFLDWLENTRNVSVSSRNQRLAAIKSFCRYASSTSMEHLEIFQRILDIKPKKATSKTIDYLTVDAIALLLKKPNPGTRSGIRDLALLSLLYESGCRVQELIDIKMGNVSFNAPSIITVTGKGNKIRVIPISSNVADIVKKYAKTFKISENGQYLFTNQRKEALTRSGVAYILRKYVERVRQEAPTLLGNTKVYPHVLRHSKAMHLLESGVNLIYIRDLLGHASVTTTEIYARSNPEIKRKFLEEAALKLDSSIDKYTEEEKQTLMEWLKNNI